MAWEDAGHAAVYVKHERYAIDRGGYVTVYPREHNFVAGW
jgi:hypothetical protein